MKFSNDALVNGTHYVGEIPIYYHELIEIFGRPHSGPNADLDKVTCEWRLQFQDGTVATIYDWKTDRTPMGMYDWHIGGHDDRALSCVWDTITFHRDQLVQFIRKGIN